MPLPGFEPEAWGTKGQRASQLFTRPRPNFLDQKESVPVRDGHHLSVAFENFPRCVWGDGHMLCPLDVISNGSELSVGHPGPRMNLLCVLMVINATCPAFKKAII
ncbi:hypothetical protein CEXT_710821 [Caerostris extrusa]|uniref:Uncharacterized protein n=1 Tax=Caerostris extrusa TaxID=172846 RepID=A0AAV4TL38_CAEEX|nr:hypothetical protein CEXT_710821 [Caerostris extrusa]